MNITEKDIIEKLKTVKDPELGIDIYTLGLIYEIKIDDGIEIVMTLTSPLCPFGGEIVTVVEEALAPLAPENVRVEVTFDPPWEPSKELCEMLGL